MDLITAIILGIVEGVTEFLPISSTGHLILTSSLLKIHQSEFLKTFEIAIQLGAISSVVVLYWKSLVLDIDLAKKVGLAFIPTALIGLIFYRLIKSFLLGSETIVIWSILLGGIFIIVFELWYKRKAIHKEEMGISYKQAFLIGLAQSIAIVPGVSRSAATIIGGLALGISRKRTMVAAVTLDLSKQAHFFTHSQIAYLSVGFLVSFVTATLAIKFLLSFIKNNSFLLFGIYRIVLAVLFLRALCQA